MVKLYSKLGSHLVIRTDVKMKDPMLKIIYRVVVFVGPSPNILLFRFIDFTEEEYYVIIFHIYSISPFLIDKTVILFLHEFYLYLLYMAEG